MPAVTVHALLKFLVLPWQWWSAVVNVARQFHARPPECVSKL